MQHVNTIGVFALQNDSFFFSKKYREKQINKNSID